MGAAMGSGLAVGFQTITDIANDQVSDSDSYTLGAIGGAVALFTLAPTFALPVAGAYVAMSGITGRTAEFLAANLFMGYNNSIEELL